MGKAQGEIKDNSEIKGNLSRKGIEINAKKVQFGEERKRRSVGRVLRDKSVNGGIILEGVERGGGRTLCGWRH